MLIFNFYVQLVIVYQLWSSSNIIVVSKHWYVNVCLAFEKTYGLFVAWANLFTLVFKIGTLYCHYIDIIVLLDVKRYILTLNW